MSEGKSAPEVWAIRGENRSAVSAVLGYPARSKILQGFSSPDEVSNGARIGEFAAGRRPNIQLSRK